MIAPKMLSPFGPRSVVLMVIDATDFKGSFPRKLAKLLSTTIEKNYTTWKEGKPGNDPRVLLVVTKCDMFPSLVSPEWLEEWVRRRVHECTGFLKLTGIDFNFFSYNCLMSTLFSYENFMLSSQIRI